MTDLRIRREQSTTDAIRVLTQAAHYSTDSTNALDLAGFPTHVLTATAANVGGSERLLAARPGSRETSHLRALLHGTIGERARQRQSHRTEPLLVPLNVAELIQSPELDPGLLGLDEAIDAIGLRYTSTDDGDALDAWDVEIDATIRCCEVVYRMYADRFEIAVRVLGKILKAPVDIRLIAGVNPTSSWRSDTTVTNPTNHDADALTVAVWRAARDSVPLPNVDVLLPASADRSLAREEGRR